MKTLFSIVLFTLSFTNAGSSFEDLMKEAMKSYSNTATVADKIEAAATFRTIAEAHPSKWTPGYYQAILHINASMEVNDPAVKNQQLRSADLAIKQLEQGFPKNAEILTLRALYHVGELMADYRKAPQVSPLIEVNARKALQLSPDNLRAHYLLLSNEMGRAQHFGSDISGVCNKAQELVEKYDAEKPAERFAPTWGMDELTELAESCKK